MGIAGTTANFHLDNASAALTEISSHIRNLTFNPTRGQASDASLGDTSEEYIQLLKDGTIQIDGNWNSTIDAILAHSIITGASGLTKSFQYDPEGGGGGTVRYTGECFVNNYSINPPVDGIQTYSATLQITGDVTRATI